MYVPSDQPLEFEWWVYIPAGFNIKTIVEAKYKGSGPISTAADSASAVEKFGRIRMRIRKVDGSWTLWETGPGFGGSMGINHSEFLEDVSQLAIGVAAEDGPILLANDEAFQLLHIAAADPSKLTCINIDMGHPTAVDEMRIERSQSSP